MVDTSSLEDVRVRVPEFAPLITFAAILLGFKKPCANHEARGFFMQKG